MSKKEEVEYLPNDPPFRAMNWKINKEGRVLFLVLEAAVINHFIVMEYRDGKYYTKEIALKSHQDAKGIIVGENT